MKGLVDRHGEPLASGAPPATANLSRAAVAAFVLMSAAATAFAADAALESPSSGATAAAPPAPHSVDEARYALRLRRQAEFLAFNAVDGPRAPNGAISWKLLRGTQKTGVLNTDGRFGPNVAYRFVPSFAPQLQALNATRVRIEGFPIFSPPEQRPTRLILSSHPTADGDCATTGVEGIVIVEGRAPIDANIDEPLILEGTLVLDDPAHPSGVFYRLQDAVPVEASQGYATARNAPTATVATRTPATEK